MHHSSIAWDAAAGGIWGAPAAGCVIDVSLSLRPCGLFWTLALARTMPVWLPQGHWTLVQDKTYAREYWITNRLSGAQGEAGTRAFRESTKEWEAARHGLRLEGHRNIYWAGDNWTESVVPKEDDVGLLDRRDALAAAFDARLLSKDVAEAAQTHPEFDADGSCEACVAPDILADCARDALALAAALKSPQPVVLATMEVGDESPGVVQWLERSGVCCKRIESGFVREALRWFLAPALLRSGLAVPVEAGKIRLAGLLLVAPRVVAATLDDSLDWGAASANEVREFWDDASAIWWEAP
jgi:hypothetical protein